MEFVIGVDAGGTTTAAHAYDYRTGELVGRGVGGYGNVLIDFEAAAAHMEDAIRQAMTGLSGNCRLIFVGAAGAATGDVSGSLSARLTGAFGCPAVVDTDARLALEGSLQGGDGVLVISGTGSIAQGRKDGQLIMVGGWGYLVGDEGSGYDLVTQAVRIMTHDTDYDWPEKPVCQAVREFFGAKTAREVIRYLHGHTKGEIAAAAPVVVQCAEAGDPDARAILTKAGEDLGRLVICVARRMKLAPGFTLGLQGSVLHHVTQIREVMLKTVAEAGVSCTLSPVTDTLTKGAWYYAHQNGF